MSNAIENITVIKAKIAELQKEIKPLFLAACSEIFTEHPILVSFGWRQYTPYFNDGEACEFSAITEYFSIEVKGEEEEEEFSAWRIRGVTVSSPKQKVAQRIDSLLTLLSDEDYKDMFGDHMKVKVTAEGIETTEYDHD